MQCRPGSHMPSVKKHSYTLFPRFKSVRRETIKTIKKNKKNRWKRKLVFSPKDIILTKDILSKRNSNNDSVN